MNTTSSPTLLVPFTHSRPNLQPQYTPNGSIQQRLDARRQRQAVAKRRYPLDADEWNPPHIIG